MFKLCGQSEGKDGWLLFKALGMQVLHLLHFLTTYVKEWMPLNMYRVYKYYYYYYLVSLCPCWTALGTCRKTDCLCWWERKLNPQHLSCRNLVTLHNQLLNSCIFRRMHRHTHPPHLNSTHTAKLLKVRKHLLLIAQQVLNRYSFNLS